jgi:hypothetical protein
MTNNEMALLNIVLDGLFYILIVFLLFELLYNLVTLISIKTILTTQNIIQVDGIFSVNVNKIPLSNIENIDLKQSPIGLLLNYGTINWNLVKSNTDILPSNTIILNLEGSYEDILNRMKPKTRYNIGLAHRKGIDVRTMGFKDLDQWYNLYLTTATRNGLHINELRYFQSVMEAKMKNEDLPVQVKLLIAYLDNQPLAAMTLGFHPHSRKALRKMVMDSAVRLPAIITRLICLVSIKRSSLNTLLRPSSPNTGSKVRTKCSKVAILDSSCSICPCADGVGRSSSARESKQTGFPDLISKIIQGIQSCIVYG